jgi:hypothetical protein
MLGNFLTVAFRKMARNKTSTLVNIVGLSLGISCSLMIAVLLRFEFSFNSQYPKKDRLYRVVTDEIREGEVSQSGASPGGMAEALLKDFPDVEQAALVYVEGDGLFSIRHDGAERKFKERRTVTRVQPTFFEMFDIEWIEGLPAALNEPNTVALASSVAKRFFGTESPLGKTVRWNNETDLRVVGIVPDPPRNIDLEFTVYISAADLKHTQAWMFDWRNLSTNVQVIALLRAGATPSHIESQFPKFKELYLKNLTDEKRFHLQPLAAMHLDPDYASGMGGIISRSSLMALGVIGIFLVLAACVNFINMATAQATNRSREVGVRKVLGAFPKQIIAQFLGETFLVVLLSVALSLVIVEVVMPLLAARLEIPVQLTLPDPVTLGFIGGLTIATTLLSGLYPAFILAGFMPALALKGKVTIGGLKLRRGLVVVQFAISQMLLIGLLVVTLQMQYVREHDMGLRSEGVVLVPLPSNEKTKLQTLKHELLSRAQIRSVSLSLSSAISGNFWATNIGYQGNNEDKLLLTDLKFADEDYPSTYGLTLVAGRNCYPVDTIREFIVNEAFIQKMGIQNPADAIGRMIRLGRGAYKPIVGVVKNFNAHSLHEDIQPCLVTTRAESYQEAGVKIQASDMQATLSHIEQSWSRVFPEYVFEREFLDDRIASFYEQELRIEFLFRLFSSIAILIGCIGLVGLVSFIAMQRTKEIGIRKVLGASITSILVMFSKEFVQLILLAFALAAPAAYYVMSNWLQDFAFRITIGPLVFILAVSTTMLVSAITIGYRALRAATTNPADALRYE